MLTMGPALVAFLTDAQGQGWVDASIAGAVILAINSLVKFIQVGGFGGKTTEVPAAAQSAPMGVASSPSVTPPKLSAWLLG